MESFFQWCTCALTNVSLVFSSSLKEKSTAWIFGHFSRRVGLESFSHRVLNSRFCLSTLRFLWNFVRNKKSSFPKVHEVVQMSLIIAAFIAHILLLGILTIMSDIVAATCVFVFVFTTIMLVGRFAQSGILFTMIMFSFMDCFAIIIYLGRCSDGDCNSTWPAVVLILAVSLWSAAAGIAAWALCAAAARRCSAEEAVSPQSGNEKCDSIPTVVLVSMV